MSQSDFLYFYSGLIVSFFYTCGLLLIFKNKFKFPYCWYELVLFYWGSLYFFYLPSLTHYWNEIHWCIVRDTLNNLGMPVVMLASVRLAHINHRWKRLYPLYISIPIILYSILSNLPAVPRAVDITLLGIIAVIAILWARMMIISEKEYNIHLREYLSNTEQSDFGWLNVWSVIILAVILLWCARNMITPGISITISLDIIIYIPGFLIFAYLYNHFSYFDVYEYEKSVEPPAIGPAQKARPDKMAGGLTEPAAVASTPCELNQNAPKPIVQESPKPITESSPKQEAQPVESGEAKPIESTTVSSEPTETTQAVFDRIEQALDKLEQREPFFLQSDLNIRDLALKIETNRTYLSNYFSSRNTSFYEYIEDLRMKYAVDLMRQNADTSIDLIAARSGFGSRTNFYKAFSRKFNTTPSKYRDDLNRNAN